MLQRVIRSLFLRFAQPLKVRQEWSRPDQFQLSHANAPCARASDQETPQTQGQLQTTSHADVIVPQKKVFPSDRYVA